MSQPRPACCGTSDCTKSVERVGSMPQAMYNAKISSTRLRSSVGSTASGTVKACRSATNRKFSYLSWLSAHRLIAPM